MLDLRVSPDGRNLYAVASRSNVLRGPRYQRVSDTVVAFARDPVGGGLRQLPREAGCLSAEGQSGCRIVRGLDGITALDLSPDGRSAYVTAAGQYLTDDAGGIARLNRSLRTGALSQPSGATGCFEARGRGECKRDPRMANARALVVAPNGRDLHIAVTAYEEILSYRRASSGALQSAGCVGDPANSCATLSGGFPDDAPAFAFAPGGRRLFLTETRLAESVSVFTRDRRTGKLQELRCDAPLPRLGCGTLGRNLTRVAPTEEVLYATTDEGVLALRPGLTIDPTTSQSGVSQVALTRDAVARLPVRCDAVRIRRCRGLLRLVLSVDDVPARSVTVQRRVDLLAGRSARIAVRLPPSARRYLQFERGESASVTATITGPDGARIVTKAFAFVTVPRGGLRGTPASRPCLPRGGQELVRAPTGRIVSRVKDGVPITYGCLFAKGRLVALEDNDGDTGDFFARPAALAGSFAGFQLSRYSYDAVNDYNSSYVAVVNLRTGAKTRRVCANGDDFCLDNAGIDSLVLKPNGAVAWIAAGQVRKLDARSGEPLLLGEGAEARSLRLVGSTLSWIEKGTPRTASLD